MLSRSRLLSSIAIAALLCVLAAWWWSSGSAERHDVAPVAPIASRAASSEAELQGAAPLAQTVDAVASETPPARAEQASDALESGGVLVRVQMRGTHEPVAGASVRWLDEWDLAPKHEDAERLMPLDVQRLLDGRGFAARTDELGTLRIPRPRMGTVVSARLGQDYASAYVVPRSESVLVLELARQRRQEVRVVDAVGKPRSGVAVALVSFVAQRRSIVRCEDTDSEGRVRFDTIEIDQAVDPMRVLAASFGFPLRELVQQELGRGDGPFAPIELRLPPTGSLRVRLLEHDGRPSERDGSLTISEPHLAVGSVPEAQRDRAAHFFAYRKGELYLPHVGLGLSLRVGLRDDVRATWQDYVHGPTRAGEEVVLEFRRPPPAPLLRGRVIAAETGEPLAHVRLRVAHPHFSGELGRVEPVPTDAAGRFQAPISELWRTRAADVRRLQLSLPHGPGPLRETTVELPLKIGAQGIDLGDRALAYSTPPLIAAGWVLEAGSGAPIPDARIELLSWNVHEADRSAFWFPAELDCAFTGERGAFELRGDAPQAKLALRASKAHHRGAEQVEFSAGSAGIELRLDVRGGLEGTLLVDPRIDARRIWMQFVPNHAGLRLDRPLIHCERSGRFTVEGLVPGSYALHLAESQVARSLIVIEDVEVRGGETVRHPRLQAIDLRDLLRPIDVRVLDAKGKPLANGSVHVLGPELGPDRWRSVHPISDGVASVVAAAPALDLHVSAGGHRPLRLETVSGDVEVQLERGFAVCLEFPDLRQQPHESAQLVLRPAAETEVDPAQRYLQLSSTDERVLGTGARSRSSACLALPRSGTWRVSGTRRLQENGRDLHVPLEAQGGGTEWTIDVLDQPEEQRFTLRFVPDAPAPSASGD